MSDFPSKQLLRERLARSAETLSVGDQTDGAERFGEHNDYLYGQHPVENDVMEDNETRA